MAATFPEKYHWSGFIRPFLLRFCATIIRTRIFCIRIFCMGIFFFVPAETVFRLRNHHRQIQVLRACLGETCLKHWRLRQVQVRRACLSGFRVRPVVLFIRRSTVILIISIFTGMLPQLHLRKDAFPDVDPVRFPQPLADSGDESDSSPVIQFFHQPGCFLCPAAELVHHCTARKINIDSPLFITPIICCRELHPINEHAVKQLCFSGHIHEGFRFEQDPGYYEEGITVCFIPIKIREFRFLCLIAHCCFFQHDFFFLLCHLVGSHSLPFSLPQEIISFLLLPEF